MSTRKCELPGAAGPVPATVSTTGEGPGIVFLHGLVGLNDHWETVVRGVRGNMHCTLLEIPLLDLKGDDCSIDGVSKLTAQFLADHLTGPTVLVGNSFGGHVALRVALEYPHLVRGLILAGSSGLIEKSMVSTVQIRPSKAWLEEKIGELFFDRAKMPAGDVDRAFNELSRRGGARAMVKLSRSARRNHLGDRLKQIKQPTLLIWGRQDIVTPPEAADGFMSMLPNARIVWLDRCGHAPMIECPAEFSQAMIAFMNELGQ
ncbi:MAG: alpha/beta hydrolase [Planctomycetota bacterium]|nr:alpha/beta hydrolase [Planctomycetota bacterium]